MNARFADVNGRFDDLRSEMNRRLDDIIGRLDRTEKNHEERIVRLEERTPLIR